MSDTMQRNEAHSAESDLNRTQDLALEALLAGSTMTAAAAAASVSRATVHRWLRDPVFLAEFNGRKAELRDSARANLQRLLAKALDSLEAALDAGDGRIALSLIRGLGLLDGTPPQIGPDDPERIVKDLEAAARQQALLDSLTF